MKKPIKRIRKQTLPNYIVEIGEQIRKIRKEKGISVTELAYRCDLDSQNLRKYENGKQEMKISTLKRIADGLEVTVSALTAF